MTKENIIITGGQLFNKGAQAMVFTVVNEMKKNHPDKEIYLFSHMDYKRPSKEKEKYSFNILPWDLRLKLRSIGFFKLFIRNKNFDQEAEKEVREVIKNTAFVIDISGYALSSQFDIKRNIEYLSNIAVFKKHNIDIYILPQSLGPFNYKFPWNLILTPFLSNYLKYPKKIFSREKDGFDSIKKFTENNLEKSIDIVLQQRDLKLENLFIDDQNFKEIEIKDNAVGIIPNVKVRKHNSGNDILKIYKQLIKFLLENNKKIYILRHSFEDLEFCEEIKELFKENQEVKIIKDDLNAIELNNILSQFDYIVGSRYHSIIHSYKNNRPALILGWAIKYQELAEYFGQGDYCFDIRSNLDITEITDLLEKLNNNYSAESKIINEKNQEIKAMNIFDKLEEK